MKHIEILEVKKALEELGKERLPVAYEVAKNTRICEKILNETSDILREIFEKYADRDEQGTPIQHQDSDPTKGSTMKITDPAMLKNYRDEIERVLNEDHEVTFVKIPRSRIQSERLTASMLVPLIDVVIE
jgi:hypothetical protein